MEPLQINGYSVYDIYPVMHKLMEYYGYYRQKYILIEHDDVYGSRFSTLDEKFEEYFLIYHLRGDCALGSFAGPKATKFISIDIDDGDPNTVRRVINTMEEMGIPRDKIYVSFSGKKGYHVDIFFRDYLTNREAKQFYILLIDRGAFNSRKVEFRPTPGQGIKIPLGIHQTTGRRCWFVDRETLEPIEDMNYVLDMEMIPMEHMKAIVHKFGNEYIKRLYDEVKLMREQSTDKTIVPEQRYRVTGCGQRHNLQVKIAIYARLMGRSRSGVFTSQMEWYRVQNPAYIGSSEDEVIEDANMIADWVMGHIAPLQIEKKEKTEAPVAVFTRGDMPYILGCRNKTQRLVAFLIWVYCRRYGKAKIAVHTMCDKVGKSQKTISDAIAYLVINKTIHKERKSIDKNTAFYIRDTNEYTLPRLMRKAPSDEECPLESIEVKEWLTKDNINEVYLSMISQMCSEEYLSRFLKKPELEEVREWKEAHVNARQSNVDVA